LEIYDQNVMHAKIKEHNQGSARGDFFAETKRGALGDPEGGGNKRKEGMGLLRGESSKLNWGGKGQKKGQRGGAATC